MAWKAFAIPQDLQLAAAPHLQFLVPAAMLVLWGVLKPVRLPRWVTWAAGGIGSVVSLALASLAAGGVFPRPLYEAAGMVLLIDYALYFLLWADIFARLVIDRAWLAVGGSYALAGMLYLMLSRLDPTVCLGVAACLPIMCSWANVNCASMLDDERPREASPRGLRTLFASKLFPWRTIAAIAGFSLAAGASRAHTSPAGDLTAVAIAGLLSLAFVIFFKRANKSLNAYQACQCVFVIMDLSLLVGLVLGDNPSAHLLIGIAQTLSTIVLVVSVASSSRRFGLPALPIFCCARAVTMAAFLAGTYIERGYASLAGESFSSLSVLYAFAAVVAVAASLLWFRRTDTHMFEAADESWARAEVGDEPPTRDAESNPQTLQALEALIKARCEAIAAEYRLSRRETEVLVLLAWGKSAKRVEELLGLSPNTVKTHVRHVYGKLGIHSRAELDALLFGN